MCHNGLIEAEPRLRWASVGELSAKSACASLAKVMKAKLTPLAMAAACNTAGLSATQLVGETAPPERGSGGRGGCEPVQRAATVVLWGQRRSTHC